MSAGSKSRRWLWWTVGPVGVLLLVAVAWVAVVQLGIGGSTSLSSTGLSAEGEAVIPSPEEVGEIAQEAVTADFEELVAAEMAAEEDTATPDSLIAYMAADGAVRVVEERVYEEDDTIVIVTLELSSPTIEGSIRWEEAYRRTVDGVTPVPMPDLAEAAE